MANDPVILTPAYREKQAARLTADRAHTERMERIAARGGTTLPVVRAMHHDDKDAFIYKYRDGGPYDV